MPRWEYCVVTGVNASPTGFGCLSPKLIFLGPTGIVQTLDLGNNGKRARPPAFAQVSETEYVAHVIADLGDRGWEMVGIGQAFAGQGTGAQALYFKRQLP